MDGTLLQRIMHNPYHIIHHLLHARRELVKLYTILKPVHTGYYSRRFRRQFVAEDGDCRRKVRLSPNSATVAVVSPFSATVAVFGDSRTFLRQCGQGFRQRPHDRQ